MPTDITWWISNLGFPGVLCFMAWRVLVFMKPIVLKFVPYVENIAVVHMNLVNTLDSQAKAGVLKLQEITDKQDVHGRKLNEICDIITHKKD